MDEQIIDALEIAGQLKEICEKLDKARCSHNSAMASTYAYGVIRELEYDLKKVRA